MPGPVKETKKRKAEVSSKKDHVDDEDSPGKRKRMSSLETSFEPGDFTVHDSTTSRVNVVVGRGKKLQEFPSVVSSMEKHTTEEVLFAHKFLFGNKGSSAKKKELLENLGEFSGYLKKVPKGYDQEKLEKEDEREEVGYCDDSLPPRCIIPIGAKMRVVHNSNVIVAVRNQRKNTPKRRSR